MSFSPVLSRYALADIMFDTLSVSYMVCGYSELKFPCNVFIRVLQTEGLRHEVQELHAKLEQQERALGGAQQSARTAQEQLSELREENAALSLRKAEVEQLQNLHAEHAHIFRQGTLSHHLGVQR